LNNSEIDMLSEIQAPEAAETFSQVKFLLKLFVAF